MSLAPSASAFERAATDLLLEALRRGQKLRLRATSWSMHPTIRPGDLLVAEGGVPTVGEIALVLGDDALVTHRVQAREEDAFVLRGDAPGSRPHRVETSAVVGRVVVVRRDLHSWAAWLVRRLPQRR